MTREEHLQWCKERALAYCDIDDTLGALASICSDLQSHAETKDHPGIVLGFMLMQMGNLKTAERMREFIQGFN